MAEIRDVIFNLREEILKINRSLAAISSRVRLLERAADGIPPYDSTSPFLGLQGSPEEVRLGPRSGEWLTGNDSDQQHEHAQRLGDE